MAEASFNQARTAFEKFLAGAQQTAGTIEERGATVAAGAKDIGAKAISYAEKNVQASLDYAQSLLQAKDLTDVMRLHSEYVQTQMRSLAEQASEMGQIVSRGGDRCRQAENLTSRILIVELPKVDLGMFLSRNVRFAGACHAALHLKIALRCTILTRYTCYLSVARRRATPVTFRNLTSA